ncbi:hypothetical protein H2200_003751 [Cladophialophora chaetospira]|uniref:Uncharacterized protein n=1 Tax=Cladophialophora chaetospira TaxID=386627 RepID=A0AA39CK96_9EURO|nr:hypothetical protein H2200_003751 [Cladophialophora chaetospira]
MPNPQIKFVQDDAGRPIYIDDDYAKPRDVKGHEIHPIFAQEMFRYADYSRFLAPFILDQEEQDFPDTLYERMKPALRLATWFLRAELPDLTRIRHGPLEKHWINHGAGGFEDRYIAACYNSINEIDEFEQETLPQIYKDFRFTILTEEHAATLTGAHADSAHTRLLVSHGGLSEDCQACETVLYPQTALNSKWLWFLADEDWDTMADAEKYGKLFLLAKTLIHEIAHLCWIDRVKPSVDSEEVLLLRPGEVPIDAEPRFGPHLEFYELGYGIELQLFQGCPGFPNHGSHSTIEPAPNHGEAYRVPFSLLATNGMVKSIHDMAKKTIFDFFTPSHYLWWPFEDHYGYHPLTVPEVEYEILLMQNNKSLRRPLSSDLSSPPDQCAAPIVKLPDPTKLKPAITAINPLVHRDSEGNVPLRKQSRLRQIKMRIRALVSSNGTWWSRSVDDRSP